MADHQQGCDLPPAPPPQRAKNVEGRRAIFRRGKRVQSALQKEVPKEALRGKRARSAQKKFVSAPKGGRVNFLPAPKGEFFPL